MNKRYDLPYHDPRFQDSFREAIKSNFSWKEVMKEMGLTSQPSVRKKLQTLAVELNVDTSHFLISYDKDWILAFIKIVNESKSRQEVFQKLGWKSRSQSYRQYNKLVSRLKLNPSHEEDRIDYDNPIFVQDLTEAVKQCTSISGVIKKMGYTDTRYNAFRSKIKQLNLDVSHFRKQNNYEDPEFHKLFREIVKNSYSFAEVQKKLDMSTSGPSREIKKLVARLAIDTSHFLGKASRKGQIKKDLSSYKCKARLKSHLLKVRGHKCENCGLHSWLNRPIPIQMHHIDGNSHNNHVDNVQLLCLNCHGQTDSYCKKRDYRDPKVENAS